MKRVTLSFDDLLKSVTKEEFESYYFNNSKTDTQSHFNIGSSVWNRFIKYYNISKPKECIEDVRKKTCLSKYGVDNIFKDTDKIKQSYIRKDGSIKAHYTKCANVAKEKAQLKGYNSMSQTPEVQAKRRRTCKGRYGTEYAFQNKDIINKISETKQLRYGNSHYNNLDQIEATKLERYGVKCNFASTDAFLNGRGTYHRKLKEDSQFRSDVVDKRKSTCMEKYGDDYYINQIKLMINKISSRANSKVNNAFMYHLMSLAMPFEREIQVGNYIYDFRLGKYLVEIDPYSTHNSTWGIFGKPKEIDYHRKKSLNAVENGYKCIHIFDWVNIDEILYHLTNHDFELVDTGKPVKHIFDIKKMELTNKESENTVVIYDDGFNMIV